jgi:hypothetical protein
MRYILRSTNTFNTTQTKTRRRSADGFGGDSTPLDATAAAPA